MDLNENSVVTRRPDCVANAIVQRSAKDPKKQTAAQRGAVPGFWIPTSPEDWHQLVLAAKLTKQTINTLPAVLFGSGSVASQSQYLMTRAFSPVMEFGARYALTTRMKEFGFNKGLKPH
ncbi:fungal specific transcription factor domain family protein [Penicillium bovifimosum]|uniref:Fungal specific transcription factor domain family protein n=1 Tax=Penicillium bovifimosum TaxID=126998 RepID=A0A9W9GMU6_9EURO|nr:fungal specific transcription factor domain family protein [Penicillium bovifimosum]KAJ5123917.1 fungal specific transcription factor domain family protein [Penicillium bovifimosum]